MRQRQNLARADPAPTLSRSVAVSELRKQPIMTGATRFAESDYQEQTNHKRNVKENECSNAFFTFWNVCQLSENELRLKMFTPPDIRSRIIQINRRRPLPTFRKPTPTSPRKEDRTRSRKEKSAPDNLQEKTLQNFGPFRGHVRLWADPRPRPSSENI